MGGDPRRATALVEHGLAPARRDDSVIALDTPSRSEGRSAPDRPWPGPPFTKLAEPLISSGEASD